MRNLLVGIKKFLSNKNTVTILGIVLAVFVLYIGYNRRISDATDPVPITIAKETIPPRTTITEDMLMTIYVPKTAIQGNVVTSKSKIEGKSSRINTVIPSGSMFYEETIIERELLPNAFYDEVPDGSIPFVFPVDMQSTYGNSIAPNDYIDIYFKGVNDGGEVMFGKLFSDVKVLSVKDSDGQEVFETAGDFEAPSLLIFALPTEPENMFLILKKATYLTFVDAELIVVPKTEEVTTTSGITSSFLVDFINAKTASVPQDVIDNAYKEAQEVEEEEEEEEVE